MLLTPRRCLQGWWSIALVLGVAFPDLALGQGEAVAAQVNGVVRDAISQAPIVGAVVLLGAEERRVETHVGGRFVFRGVAAGPVSIEVRRVGYAPRIVNTTVPQRPGEVLEILLTATAIELPTIVVTSGLGTRPADQALQPVTVLEGQSLTRAMGGTIAATLDGTPGVSSVSMGPATARPVIRGLGGDRVLLLEDGARTGDMSYSSPDHSVVTDVIGAERLEVVRGPGALMYGSNALSGVVNVIRDEIPTSVPDAVHGRIAVRGASVNEAATIAAHLLVPMGSLVIRGEGSFQRAGDLRTPEGQLANTGIESFTGALALATASGWGHAGAVARHTQSEYGVPGGFVGGHPAGVTINQRRTVFRGQAHRRTGFGPFTEVEVDAGFIHYAHEEIEAGGILGTAFRVITADADLILHHEALGPFAAGGFGGRVQVRDFAFGGGLATPNAREVTGALFGVEEIASGRWRAQVGARFDWTRIEPQTARAGVGPRTFGAMSGSLGVLYALSSEVTIGANGGRAFRSPDVNDLYSRGPHLAVYREEIGNPNLDLETALGLDAFVRVEQSRFRAELSVFRNAINGFIYPEDTGETSQRDLPVARFVGRDALLTGAEGLMQWEIRPSTVLVASASHVHGSLREDGTPLPLIPPLRGSVELRHERPTFTAGIGTRWALRQDRLGEFEAATDGFAVHHMMAGVRWSWTGRLHDVTLRLDNFTNVAWRDHLSRVKSIRPEAGRNLSVLYRIDI